MYVCMYVCMYVKAAVVELAHYESVRKKASTAVDLIHI